MHIFQEFKFHLLLQETIIPELEKLLRLGETKFKVVRLGTYELLPGPTREHSSGVYKDKSGQTYSVERVA